VGQRPPVPPPATLAKAAADKGVPYTFVTGIAANWQPTFGKRLGHALHRVMVSETIERFDAVFTGAGDTLSAALAGLLAMGDDLEASGGRSAGLFRRQLGRGFSPWHGPCRGRPFVLGAKRG
jgi:hydroxymethylpyrimidine/phosphomethylpyrimidine kinase